VASLLGCTEKPRVAPVILEMFTSIIIALQVEVGQRYVQILCLCTLNTAVRNSFISLGYIMCYPHIS